MSLSLVLSGPGRGCVFLVRIQRNDAGSFSGLQGSSFPQEVMKTFIKLVSARFFDHKVTVFPFVNDKCFMGWYTESKPISHWRCSVSVWRGWILPRMFLVSPGHTRSLWTIWGWKWSSSHPVLSRLVTYLLASLIGPQGQICNCSPLSDSLSTFSDSCARLKGPDFCRTHTINTRTALHPFFPCFLLVLWTSSTSTTQTQQSAYTA